MLAAAPRARRQPLPLTGLRASHRGFGLDATHEPSRIPCILTKYTRLLPERICADYAQLTQMQLIKSGSGRRSYLPEKALSTIMTRNTLVDRRDVYASKCSGSRITRIFANSVYHAKMHATGSKRGTYLPCNLVLQCLPGELRGLRAIRPNATHSSWGWACRPPKLVGRYLREKALSTIMTRNSFAPEGRLREQMLLLADYAHFLQFRAF